MKVEFEGSLSDVRAEMQEFLDGSPEGGKAGKAGGKASTGKVVKAEVKNADTLRELMLSISDKDGKKAVLANYGVSKISEIDADQIEGIYDDMKKLS